MYAILLNFFFRKLINWERKGNFKESLVLLREIMTLW